MAFDEGLAERIHDYFQGRPDVETKKMFGGLCFMVSNHMCCGIVGDTLMARVGPDNYETCLLKKYAKEMDFTGKPMKGFVYVGEKGFEADKDLKDWIDLAYQFVSTLPKK